MCVCLFGPQMWVKRLLVIPVCFFPAVPLPTHGGQAHLLSGLRKTSAGDSWGGKPWRGGSRILEMMDW